MRSSKPSTPASELSVSTPANSSRWVERLQQHRPQQHLGRDRWPPKTGIEPREIPRQLGSPEADDRREPASPDRHTKTTPPRARQTPASLPPVRYPQSGNHGDARNATAFSTAC